MTDFERTFDNAVEEYDDNRPMYPTQLFADLLAYQPLGTNSCALEIGLGSGKASKPVLDTGCRLVGVEPGEQLAAVAKARFQSYPNFSLHQQTLQEYQGREGSFDLIYAATAFHWIAEEYGYPRVYELLKPGGTFARFAYHAGQDQGRKALAEEIQEVYRACMPGSKTPVLFGQADAERLAGLAVKYGFADSTYKLYHITKDFTADRYIDLLKTYPNHMALEETNRKKLFHGIYQAIVRHGGVITIYYTMDMELARKP